MAYNRNKVLIYGAVGILIASSIIAFLPARTETHVVTGVGLDLIPGYGFQIVKISEDSSSIMNLVLHIGSVEAQLPDGTWVKISDGGTWDIWRDLEKTLTVDPEYFGYSRIRLNIDSDGSSVTLSDGSVIQLGVSSLPVEVELSESYEEVDADAVLRLSLEQGTMSNIMLPELMIEISTNRLLGEIVG